MLEIVKKEDFEKKQIWLSNRELEILGDVAKGLKSKEIAQNRFLSLKTVEVHRHNILKKTKAKNMVVLCSTLTKQGLLK